MAWGPDFLLGVTSLLSAHRPMFLRPRFHTAHPALSGRRDRGAGLGGRFLALGGFAGGYYSPLTVCLSLNIQLRKARRSLPIPLVGSRWYKGGHRAALSWDVN
jgi:hypothetical protein